MQHLSNTFKACCDPNRIRIIKLLEKRKMCVCELAFVLDISQPSVSKHIKKMVHAGLLEKEQDGFWTNYFIKPDNMYAQRIVNLLSEWINEDDTIVADLKKAQKASREKLCCKG